MIPETRYAWSGDIGIAYQVFGQGPHDLVVVPGWLSNVELFWEEPSVVRFFQGLASFSRVLLFDKRGTGLSDRITATPTLEERMDDVRAVMDAAGSERAALFGYSEGGPMCTLFAATYPERTEALVMCGSYARKLWAPDYPWGIDEGEYISQWVDPIPSVWGQPLGIETIAPSVANDPRFRSWWGKFLRGGASPTTASLLNLANIQIDVRHLLPSIRVPSLIFHATKDLSTPLEDGRYLAEHIPNARFIELETADHLPFTGAPERIIAETKRFLTGQHEVHEPDRAVLTVLFTDIVDSTRLASELGDTRWIDLLNSHHDAVRHQLAIHRGREIKTTGDGFHAVFDGPARAIRCACAIRDATCDLGISVRAGMHTGECELRNDQVEGIAIHIAARVAAMAAGEEVLVSQTVKDLVAGSGISFEERGTHLLKGVPDEWNILAVA